MNLLMTMMMMIKMMMNVSVHHHLHRHHHFQKHVEQIRMLFDEVYLTEINLHVVFVQHMMI
jgi:hypothetical protein